MGRLGRETIQEVILATNPTTEEKPRFPSFTSSSPKRGSRSPELPWGFPWRGSKIHGFHDPASRPQEPDPSVAMIPERAFKVLSSILGPEHLTTRAEDLMTFGTDATKLRFMPDAVAFPALLKRFPGSFDWRTRNGSR